MYVLFMKALGKCATQHLGARAILLTAIKSRGSDCIKNVVTSACLSSCISFKITLMERDAGARNVGTVGGRALKGIWFLAFLARFMQ
jgi:hypothetical protein